MREGLSYWDAAQSDAKIRYSINTRITHETVFRHFSRQLSELGVTTVQQFKRVLHTTQSLECSRRRKKLDQQRDGRKKHRKNNSKCPLKVTAFICYNPTLTESD